MKQRAFNRAERTKQQTDWDYYRSLVKKNRQTCSLAYNQYINDCISSNIKYNPKRFLTFIKSKRCDNLGVSPLNSIGARDVFCTP